MFHKLLKCMKSAQNKRVNVLTICRAYSSRYNWRLYRFRIASASLLLLILNNLGSTKQTYIYFPIAPVMVEYSDNNSALRFSSYRCDRGGTCPWLDFTISLYSQWKCNERAAAWPFNTMHFHHSYIMNGAHSHAPSGTVDACLFSAWLLVVCTLHCMAPFVTARIRDIRGILLKKSIHNDWTRDSGRLAGWLLELLWLYTQMIWEAPIYILLHRF